MKSMLYPKTLAEALALRSRYPEALIMAGGTDLMARPALVHGDAQVLYIGMLSELKEITAVNGQLSVGACATLSALQRDARLPHYAPLLRAAVASMASPQIRNRGTLGGNLMNASPAGDGLTALHALHAQALLVSLSKGEIAKRTLPVSELVTGPGRTALGPGELLAAILIPRNAGPFVFEKVSGRNAMAIGMVTLAMQVLDVPPGEPCLRVAIGACGPRVVRCPEAEALLRTGCSKSDVAEAISRLTAALSPQDDIRASAEYRRNAAERLLKYHISKLMEEIRYADRIPS